MTGTALTEETEFQEIYKLDVVGIPTNKDIARVDHPDAIFKTERGKFLAIIDEIKEANSKGQPVLVGTISIEKSEMLSKMLKKSGITHNVLNAKHHEKEAQIVAQAGKLGAVTIATNMAGRGTDIVLGGNAEYMAKSAMRKDGFSDELIEEATSFAETDDKEIIEARKTYTEYHDKFKAEISIEAQKVRQAGGLYIIGTERHESRRIDNQLRGRSGRQGDPGQSRFFLSCEDDLMRIFGGERMGMMLDRMNVEETMPIENGMLSNIIENSQQKVESRNFAIRKSVLDYDDVLNKQREIIYTQRNQVLNGENIHDTVIKMVEDTIVNNVNMYLASDIEKDSWNLSGLNEFYRGWLISDDNKFTFTADELEMVEKEYIIKTLTDRAMQMYEENEALFDDATMREMERVYLLKSVDTYWMDHIDNMDQLKQGIRLRAYGQRDPVVEYRLEGFDMFDDMIESIRQDTAKLMLVAPKRVLEIQRRQAEIERQKKEMEEKAAAAHQVILGKQNDDKPNAVTLALKREQVAKPVETAGDGTMSTNRTVVKKNKIGRNDPCPCGSGKKYKKCCGRDA